MNRQYITVTELCKWHRIERQFIHSLHEVGLVQIIEVENEEALTHQELAEVEKMIRMHYELEINVEGIDVVYNLLNQIDDLKQEVLGLQNRLKKYED